ncbi:class I SAM-dependent methyltransferase [Amycolatopsis suaedae]|uniref:class I SAM-dependent methyltransferase n=1 Tax=Amycolatopsis suaedae TaxID=2510978 RepID=UPI001F10774C|nr:class I SAM-dependent methyltransferase [Amycolatopsis suaedae]
MSELESLNDAVTRVMSGVDTTIAEGDTMLDGPLERYLDVSAGALRTVLAALQLTGHAEPKRVLDFGCGYGRVQRALRAAFPAAQLYACDVDPAAVAHCAAAFGAVPVAGSADVDQIEQVTDIDLVWCGSVLTHLDVAGWTGVLRYFGRALAPGGVAVVTTHGRRMAYRAEQDKNYGLEPRVIDRVLAAYHACGFGYADYSFQPGYGISITSPSWAIARALETPGLRLAGYDEAAWDNHQDVMVLVKDVARLWT